MKRARHIYGRPSDRVSFPTALLGAGLSPSEVYVYVLLLDRAASAAASEKTPSRDPEEEPFICFPVQELAEALGRSAACIKLALFDSLNDCRLISKLYILNRRKVDAHTGKRSAESNIA